MNSRLLLYVTTILSGTEPQQILSVASRDKLEDDAIFEQMFALIL